jgi:pyrimidine-specific ribonucleoside hydrolase
MDPVPVVIDTDPGIDDVVALALALRSPELDVAAVVTSYGNSTLDRTTRNAHRLLEILGRTGVPVIPGVDRPLSRALVTAPEAHGPSGVGHAPVLPAPAIEPDPDALLWALDGCARPVVLITLGPLTNLALALERDAPLLRRRVTRHLGMFGSLRERGNTNRWADFNAWCDPEAAERVLDAQLGTVMVGLDVTRRMTFAAGDVAGFARSADPLVGWLGAALQFYVEFHRSQGRLDGCVVHDVLPVGELLAPGLLTLAQRRIRVDLDEGEHRGHTVEYTHGAPTEVALGVDIPRMGALLARVFRPGAGA